MGVPHSISELEVRGCSKACSEIGLFPGESGFLGVGFLDFVASLQKSMNDARARLAPIIRYLRTKKKSNWPVPTGVRIFVQTRKKMMRVKVPIRSPRLAFDQTNHESQDWPVPIGFRIVFQSRKIEARAGAHLVPIIGF